MDVQVLKKVHTTCKLLWNSQKTWKVPEYCNITIGGPKAQILFFCIRLVYNIKQKKVVEKEKVV